MLDVVGGAQQLPADVDPRRVEVPLLDCEHLGPLRLGGQPGRGDAGDRPLPAGPLLEQGEGFLLPGPQVALHHEADPRHQVGDRRGHHAPVDETRQPAEVGGEPSELGQLPFGADQDKGSRVDPEVRTERPVDLAVEGLPLLHPHPPLTALCSLGARCEAGERPTGCRVEVATHAVEQPRLVLAQRQDDMSRRLVQGPHEVSRGERAVDDDTVHDEHVQVDQGASGRRDKDRDRLGGRSVARFPGEIGERPQDRSTDSGKGLRHQPRLGVPGHPEQPLGILGQHPRCRRGRHQQAHGWVALDGLEQRDHAGGRQRRKQAGGEISGLGGHDGPPEEIDGLLVSEMGICASESFLVRHKLAATDPRTRAPITLRDKVIGIL